ncbi:hypothetical protein KL86DPRO_11184 [uncultured delta proteobacterium]|uniref:Uncharacterized protein n=1 Tax=uncultured delta proteobacterium TaxID=34034 RepID=A0A212JCW9_9DELT|nr:hypothetical protein KL86DPRO_11184 [uncultured delta proteobacterium]
MPSARCGLLYRHARHKARGATVAGAGCHTGIDHAAIMTIPEDCFKSLTIKLDEYCFIHL